MEKIAVIGGGLVGSLQAIFMAERGYKVDVFERRSDSRSLEIKVGKSINLALSYRGLKALNKIGLKDKSLQVASPMYGRMIHSSSGETTFQPYGDKNQCIYSVSRWGLNKILLNHAEDFPNITLNFNTRCEEIDLEKNELTFAEIESGHFYRNTYDRVFGADGAYSIIRQNLMKSGRFDFSQTYLDHGYKELTIPPDKNGQHRIDPRALHIWPRGKFMLIALPNYDGSFTCTLFLPFKGELSFDQLTTENEVFEFFKATFPDTISLLPELTTYFFRNPTSTLVTIHCSPWNYNDKVLLLGDAAHAIVPFFGQGMNAGFEDCYMLNELINAHDSNWSQIMDSFSLQRNIDTKAISELSLENYYEMRDATANPMFLLRKKIEQRIAEKFPEIWTPLYSQISFSDIPYSEAREKGIQQKQVMDKIMLLPNIENEWNTEKIETEILELLSK